MKTAMQYLDAANAAVAKISSEDAVKQHATGGGIFVDVRDSSDIAESGTIKDALRIPRGFIEFAADSELPYHVEAMQKDAEIFLVCGLGGQAALAGKTLQDMGFTKVTNIGGFGDWQKAGGPTEV